MVFCIFYPTNIKGISIKDFLSEKTIPSGLNGFEGSFAQSE